MLPNNNQNLDFLIQGLEKIRIKLIESKLFPKSLSGACNVSSILVQGYLNTQNIKAKIVNNSKHCFNILEDGTVIDLTATQLSKKKFRDIEIADHSFFLEQSSYLVKGKGFYKLDDKKFILTGDLKEILHVLEDRKNDEAALRRVLDMTNRVMRSFNDFTRPVDEVCFETITNIEHFVKDL